MATVQEIYNEIDRIDNAKSGIAGAIKEKGVEVPAGAKIEEYPGLVRQIQQGDTSDCVKFTPQTLTEEQKAQARENIGAAGKVFVETNSVSAGDAVTISSLTPNVLHKYSGGALSSLTVTALGTPASAETVNEYMIECELGASSTISFPATLKWFGGSIPTIEAGIWQFSIVDDCIVAGMFKVTS